jgi:hypothetical protein
MVRSVISSVLVFAVSMFVVGSSPDRASAADEPYRKAVLEAIRNDLVGRSFTTPQPLVEEYKEKGFRVESWREISFSNLMEAKNGFQFDLTVTTHSQRVTLEGEKKDRVQVKAIGISRYECRPLDATRSYVGIRRVIFSPSGRVLGEADGVEIKLVDGKLAILQKDLHPSVDSNDQVLCTSETNALISLKRDEPMTVRYVEYAVDE